MRFCVLSSSPVRLARLMPVFPMTVTAQRGTTVIRRDGFERVLVPGLPCIIEPFQAFDLHIAGSAWQPAGCRVEMASACGATDPIALHRDLSQRIFLQPQLPWNAAFVADLLGESPDRIRRTLFAGGAAFGELCRTQRLMRLLFEPMHARTAMPALKRSVGWPASHDLEAAFHDRFGASLHRFQCALAGEDNNTTDRRPVPGIGHHYWPSLFPA